MSILSSIFGDANARYIKSLQPIIGRINELEKEFEGLSDEELKAKTGEFKKLVASGQSLDTILPDAFAAVREAAKRTLNQRHFDVQLVGGIVLHQGKIAEMKTGEGKTLVATLPAYLNALEGKGVHIVTVNDYLSRRDAAWMGQVYNALGLTVGCINHDSAYLYDSLHIDKRQETRDKERDETGSFHVVYEFLRPVTRREAYAADITYGTNNEFGFDYLRDNLVYVKEQMSQRDHHFAIVDEVDSILIDEARTPLIISAPDEDSGKLYETFASIGPRLVENEDYNLDEKLKAVSITEKGIEKVEKALGMENIYNEGGVRYVHHLEQALKAHVLFKRDRDYVVNPSADGGEVIIVDEFTGRLMPGRRWSEGLHQAVEAKEGVKIQRESRTLATITFQNYFRLYKKLGGMTGTARTSAEEFHKVYALDVIDVPTNKPLIRKDRADKIYKNEEGKFRAVVEEIKERHGEGQPVLVGTVSIEKNELLSAMLSREGIPHNVLNAKQHEKEAELHAQAGRFGAVTVATNMAGRGVDIILGGNPSDPQEAGRVRELGGLHVIGTERHEARRIDDQLRGRAGRQGDPGSSQFFVSTQDDVIRVFGGDRLHNIMETLGVGDDDVVENKFISRAIEQAQSKIEGHNFDIRKYVLEYDDVMNKHRESVYGLRKEAVSSNDVRGQIEEFIENNIENLFDFHAQNANYEWNTEEIAESFKAMTGADIHGELSDKAKSGDRESAKNFLVNKAIASYEEKEKELGEEEMRKLEKLVLIRTIDELWMDHIEAMEYLRDSVRLRAYGQRDPLVEYKIEGQRMFQQLMSSIGTQVANIIFKVSLVTSDKRQETRKMEERRPDIVKESHSHQQNINEPVHREPMRSDEPKIGRNDPCWCNSGKKYKKCHGA
ncbi:MAG: preprotein translocase subunit SecA [Candidatus Yanofskybacteria bacterium RIFCSPHIGHO2_01_FULL_43_42]|uniref:Protein translocase subunit SecA n=1 Tax=Candidatus Yanofskybacteria bacterium RIFCSPLOWO2_01_FULL_43_22 TaxID=1802695 RepID=A0A1F8GH33_9BACT|nr:MAG: preprotein translocase subunit SecA [Candidatus Yanofskybacteria bacterium RIFCSPHIGHO2_01_FULL_43_42]OGN13196.1 MAG: preprotein translocase subunit SecA [Candidatus Yanofskybacteria bacterium RIFCSPHIGHO2_02_FULL_43_17]OGN24611.1 MAG: preprotein translocase subunit SecA [Candidatus Yanofskybacteria bacterium RIFCSPLOWO2_01_FULL_43_22]